MTHEEVELWLKDIKNIGLFRPHNLRPTPDQRLKVFEVAAFLDPNGKHKPTGCGRCYYNALRAIEKRLNIF